jgi:Membrane-associated phospholipid phosphatase
MRHLTVRGRPRGLSTVVLLVLCVASGCVQSPGSSQHARGDAPTMAAKRLPGYLQPHERPDGLALLPAPPAEGSSRFALDVDIHRAMRDLRGTPRWHLAAADADVSFPHAARQFSCALGVAITPADTPSLYVLMQRAMVDAGQSTATTKDRYQRRRPFVVYDETTCVPGDEASLRTAASYPSGHAAAGWAWALIMAEVAPERATQVLRRGYEFGESRVVCGVHWQSDVDTGRTIAAAAVARLHANAEFTAQLDSAKREVAKARAAGKPVEADCAAEARALERTAAR